MSRYVDIDTLKIPSEEMIAKMIINSAPSIDIVRCKECKHRKKNGFCLEHNRYEKNDNGYCSYGEREGE